MKDVLKYKDFIGTVHFSADDNVFFGQTRRIDDLVTFEGANVAQLRRSFEEAVEDYLEICSSLDKAPHKSYKGTFNVRIKPNLHKRAAYKSAELGLSLNQFVAQAISDKLVNTSLNSR